MTTETKLKNPGGDTHEEFDRDVDVRGIVYTGLGLAAIIALAFVGMWFFFRGLASYEERRDPAPSPLPEAAQAVRPVGPTLQATPELELEQLLALEDEMLEGYGVAEDGAYARVPIERAMEMVLAQGLGTPEGEPEPTAAEREERPAPDTPDESEGPDGE